MDSHYLKKHIGIRADWQRKLIWIKCEEFFSIFEGRNIMKTDHKLDCILPSLRFFAELKLQILNFLSSACL